MAITTDLRAADLSGLVGVLKTQRAQRHDLVVPASFITATDGSLAVDGDTVTVMDEDGVGDRQARYSVSDVAEEGIASKLGIPRAYLRKMRADHPQLWDANVNGWLQHQEQAGRKYLLRTLRDGDTGDGVARALLTNGYKPMENLDIVVAALEGIRDAGVEITIGRCDLTERRMYVNLYAKDCAVEAPGLLDGYTGPWHVDALSERRVMSEGQVQELVGTGQQPGTDAHGMYRPGQEPIIFGGLEISNSDTGGGAFQLRSKLRVLRCTNGLTMDAGKLRKVHIGSRLDDGELDWSTRTQEAMLSVVKEQTRDAVSKFLSRGWVAEQVASLEERAGVRVSDPKATVQHVTKALTYSDDRTDDILAHFMAGGQMTAGGIMQAVTSVAQTVTNGDDAAQMEADGVRALELAAAFAG